MLTLLLRSKNVLDDIQHHPCARCRADLVKKANAKNENAEMDSKAST